MLDFLRSFLLLPLIAEAMGHQDSTDELCDRQQEGAKGHFYCSKCIKQNCIGKPDAQSCFEAIGLPEMQEFKYIRGGACLAISLEGLEWLSKRKCSEEEIKKRNGKSYLQISGGQSVSEERDLQPFYGLYDCGKSTYEWTNNAITQSSESYVLKACSNQVSSTCTSLKSRDNLRTFLLNIPNNWFTDYLNQVTVATSPKERLVIVYNKNIIARLLSSAFYCLDYCPDGVAELCHNNNDKDVVDVDMADVPNSHEDTEEISERSRRRRRSVSFADDVIVYLFDKESPTVELHSEPPNSTPSSPCFNSDVLFDDNGLEWEDDFLALEKNCNCHSRSISRRCISSTQNWTVSKPERFFMSQSCLFLTHVTESDLEL